MEAPSALGMLARTAVAEICGKSQLASLVRTNGQQIKVRKRIFKVSRIRTEAGLQVATLDVPFGSYRAVLRNEGTVVGYPGAEVWSVLNGQQHVIDFAVHDGRLLTLLPPR